MYTECCTLQMMDESLGGSHTNACLLAVSRRAQCAQCKSHPADESGKISHEKLQAVCPSLLEAPKRGLGWQVISYEVVKEDRSGVCDARKWFVCLFLPRLKPMGRRGHSGQEALRGARKNLDVSCIMTHLSDRSGSKPQAIASAPRTSCPSARLSAFTCPIVAETTAIAEIRIC